MKDLLLMLAHLLTTLAKLLGPGRARAIVELKSHNTRFGCPRIAQEINNAFGVAIDKDVVRRVLEKHYRPGPDSGHGPSWLTFIGHLKNSLWSSDLFRCESIFSTPTGCS